MIDVETFHAALFCKDAGLMNNTAGFDTVLDQPWCGNFTDMYLFAATIDDVTNDTVNRVRVPGVSA